MKKTQFWSGQGTRLERSEAAIQIQRIYRGYSARQRVKRMHYAASIIQACVRGMLQRKKDSRLADTRAEIAFRDARLAATRDRLLLLEKRKKSLEAVAATRVPVVLMQQQIQAAVRIQAWVRGWRARHVEIPRILVQKELDVLKARRKLRAKARKQERLRGRQHHSGTRFLDGRDEESRQHRRRRQSSSRGSDSSVGSSSSNSEKQAANKIKKNNTNSVSSSGGGSDEPTLSNNSTSSSLPEPSRYAYTGPILVSIMESDVLLARAQIVKRVREKQRRIYLEDHVEGVRLDEETGGSKERERQIALSVYEAASGSAGRLMGGLTQAKRLLDSYYDNVEGELDVDQLADILGKNVPVEGDGYDLSLGCRALRVNTEMYLAALMDCVDFLDMEPDQAFPDHMIPPKLQARARESHLRSLRDGKKRWWQFDIDDDDVLDEVLELAEIQEKDLADEIAVLQREEGERKKKERQSWQKEHSKFASNEDRSEESDLK